MSKAKVFLNNVVFAIVAASFTYWLSAEFRAGGELGTLQRLAQPFVFLPYLASAMFGENAHSPIAPSFAVALYVQYFFIFCGAFENSQAQSSKHLAVNQFCLWAETGQKLPVATSEIQGTFSAERLRKEKD